MLQSPVTTNQQEGILFLEDRIKLIIIFNNNEQLHTNCSVFVYNSVVIYYIESWTVRKNSYSLL